ncbi:MAG: (Fe-S)-binding protein [Clostridia bacterium]
MNAFHVDTSMCVHCGLCLPSCPTYQVTGSEAESPRGRVVLLDEVRTGLLEGRQPDPAAWTALDHCLDCRACEAVCPAHVPVGHAVEELRGLAGRVKPLPLLGRQWLGSRAGIRRFRRWAKLAGRPGIRRIARLGRTLPAPWGPALSLLQGVPAEVAAHQTRRTPQPVGPRVLFFAGCVMEGLYAETNRRSADLLRRLGFDVSVEAEPLCCGALARHQGDPESGRRWAKTNIERFEESGVDFFVTNAAGCGAALKEYGAWFRDDPAWKERALAFQSRVRDVLELVDPAKLPQGLPMGSAHPQPVTVHDACHLVHAQGLKEPVRAILTRLGIPIVEMPDADLCCGSAGVYNLTHPDMARVLQARKVASVPAVVGRVVTSNPGCLLQIQSGLRSQNRPVEALHWVDVVYEALSTGETAEIGGIRGEASGVHRG